MFPSVLVSRWLTDSLCGQIRDDAKSLIDVLQDPAQSSAEVCDLYTHKVYDLTILQRTSYD